MRYGLKRLHRQNNNKNITTGINECDKKECDNETKKNNENKESLDISISKIVETNGIDNILFLEKQIKIE
jgi:hypothetical protein